MSSQCTMKNQNDEISANEEDNRNSQKHNSDNESSRKRDEPEDKGEAENENEESSANKRARVASLPVPEPEHGHALELPACFNSLDDDCLGNVLEFVGKKCYSVFGRVNKRCHEMFCSKGLPKETYLYGYAPLRLIQQQWAGYTPRGIVKGVLHYNRRDIFEWMLTNEDGYSRLNWLCLDAIGESRLDILHEVFDRANERQLELLRDCENGPCFCHTAAEYGKLECLKFLRENECEWNEKTWRWAKRKGHNHILQYLRNNGYPRKWR